MSSPENPAILTKVRIAGPEEVLPAELGKDIPTNHASQTMDHVNGAGWIELKSRNEMTGRFKFHCRDSYLFHARRIRVKNRTARRAQGEVI